MARRARPVSPFLILVLLIFIAVGGYLTFRLLVHPRQLIAIQPQVTAQLVPARFSRLPGWKSSDNLAALAAFERSCAFIARKPGAERMGEHGYAGTAAEWQAVCASSPAEEVTQGAARSFFESHFVPFEVKRRDGNGALFTGYYEPELSVSRARHDKFVTPIYGLPQNLVTADLGAFRESLQGEQLTGCVDGHKLLPCPSRAQIDAHGIDQAPVLFYADDPVALFFLHIQGSGRVRPEDGHMVRVAYAGQNGRPYKAIGRTLIERGLLTRGEMSMQAIRSWMHTHADAAREIMETDPSYVFFQEKPIGDPSLGSNGSEGVPLTPTSSIAIDARVHPLGIPFFIAATRPDADAAKADHDFDHLVIAQDTGGAIRGPARADVFWGFGKDAESIAGRMKSTGRMFVLLPKSVAEHLRADTELGVP
jgi:membrane-bound lytic murein transglycosylase A